MRTPQGQTLRLRLLQGSVIVFINAGYKGKQFIYEQARDLGVVCIIIDNPGSWSEALVEQGVVKKFLPVDMSAADVEDRIMALIKGLEDEGLAADGVMTFWETAVPLAASVAERLGLPGNSKKAIEAAKNKHETRRLMGLAGLPTPRNYLLSEPSQVDLAAEHVGFPAVLKPINGLLSIGVVRVNDSNHLRKVYKDVIGMMDGMYLSKDGKMGQMGKDGSMPDGAHPLKCQMMLEEYLDGTEVDIDVVMTGGQPAYCVVTDNWPTLEPWFNETGDNAPSLMPSLQQKELQKLAVGTLRALGLKMGVFHVEAKYTSRGPRLIEVNSRMGGGQVRDNNLAVWGVDLVDESLLAAIGLPNAPPLPRRNLTSRSALYFNAQRTGVMGDGDWLAEVRALPGVVYAKPLVSPGDEVTCSDDGLPTWLGQIMCDAPTPAEAVALVKKYEQMVVPPIIPKGEAVPVLKCKLPVVLTEEDQELLLSATPAGQAHRLSMLRDRVLVFISAGYPGKKFIFEKAQQLGVLSVIIDNPGTWSAELVTTGIIKRFIPVDMESPTVVEQIVAAIQGLMDEGLPPSGVMTFWETAVPLAARVAAALGCTGNTSKAIDAAKNKFETRRLMGEAGLPTPKNFLLESAEQLKEAAAHVGFPAVMKPINGLLSIGVVRVETEADLAKTFAETEALMNDTFLTKDGVMGKISDTGSLPEAAHLLKCQLMVEEYLDGTEVDIDVVLSGGKAVYNKVTDNWPTLEPWFNETGDNAPSMMTPDEQKSLEDLATGTLQCLGFVTGVFHVEAKLTTRGPRLIEVNSRMGGGQVRENNLAVWGVDLVDESLLASLGIPNAPVVPEKPLTCRSALYFNCMKSGWMGKGDWLESIRKMPGVVYAKLMVQEGDEVCCASDGMPTWLGQLMCNAATPEEAVALVKEYEAMVDPPILDYKPAAPAEPEPIAPSPQMDMPDMPAPTAPPGVPVANASEPAFAEKSGDQPVDTTPKQAKPSKPKVGGLSAAFGR